MLHKIYSVLLKPCMPFCTCFLLVGTSAFAQVTYNDFLEEDAVNRKAFLALRLYDRYVREDLDSIKIVGINLLAGTPDSLKTKFTYAVANRLMGGFEIRRGQIQSGMNKLSSAANYFEAKESYDMSSELYNDLGHALYLDGQFDEAVLSYRKSIRNGRLGLDQTSVYNAELGLGKTMIALGDTTRGVAIIHHYKKEALSDQKYEAAADAYGYLGQIAESQQNMELSNDYLLKSYSLGLQSKSLIHKSHALTNRAIVFVNRDQLDSAEVYFHRAKEIREELTNPRPLIESLYNLGSFYALSDDKENGRLYFLLSADLAKEMSYFTEESDALMALQEFGLDKNDNWIESRIAQLAELKSRQRGIDEEVINSLFQKEIKGMEEAGNGPIINWNITVIAFFVIIALLLYHSGGRRRTN